MELRFALLVLAFSSFFVAESQSSFRGDEKEVVTGKTLISLEEFNELDETSRRLFGSNCIRIETGNIPVYYDCLGCIIEEANACVDDLRYNLTGVIHDSCAMDSIIKVEAHHMHTYV